MISQQQVTTSSCQMENNDPMHDITSQETGVVLCYATDCLPHYCLAGCTLSWVHFVCNNLFPVVVSSQMIVLPVCLLQCRDLQNLCYYRQIPSHPLNCYLCHAVFAFALLLAPFVRSALTALSVQHGLNNGLWKSSSRRSRTESVCCATVTL